MQSLRWALCAVLVSPLLLAAGRLLSKHDQTAEQPRAGAIVLVPPHDPPPGQVAPLTRTPVVASRSAQLALARPTSRHSGVRVGHASEKHATSQLAVYRVSPAPATGGSATTPRAHVPTTGRATPAATEADARSQAEAEAEADPTPTPTPTPTADADAVAGPAAADRGSVARADSDAATGTPPTSPADDASDSARHSDAADADQTDVAAACRHAAAGDQSGLRRNELGLDAAR